MNLAVYLLRAAQLGLSMADLSLLDVGTVLDMAVEAGNDQCDYDQVAEQADFDRF